jgi:hypothetical protein
LSQNVGRNFLTKILKITIFYSKNTRKFFGIFGLVVSCLLGFVLANPVDPFGFSWPWKPQLALVRDRIGAAQPRIK